MVNQEEIDKLAKVLWKYNNLKQELRRCDAILVLGSNDIRVAHYGSELFNKGYGKFLIFSGGFGILTKILFNKPEAQVFADEAILLGVPKEKILIEDKSTNTGENILFVKEMLKSRKLDIKSFVVVQKPYMLRRAYATIKKQWPEKEFIVSGPNISYENYPNKVISKDTLINIMVGDTQRILIYPKKGFQIYQKVPKEVHESYLRLVELGFTKHLIRD